MCRTIQLHPLSLLVGVGFALLGLVAMGQMPIANRPAAQHDSMYLQVAHPKDWVDIEEGTPYVVPQGRLLVITALGLCVTSGNVADLKFDGQPALSAVQHLGLTNGGLTDNSTPSVKPVPIGLRAAPGTSAEVDAAGGGFSAGRAWGYLVDA